MPSFCASYTRHQLSWYFSHFLFSGKTFNLEGQISCLAAIFKSYKNAPNYGCGTKKHSNKNTNLFSNMKKTKGFFFKITLLFSNFQTINIELYIRKGWVPSQRVTMGRPTTGNFMKRGNDRWKNHRDSD